VNIKKYLILFLLITTCALCRAQSRPMSTDVVRLEVGGKEVKKSYKVYFLSKGKWIESERTATGFLVPDKLRAEEYLTVLITFGKYKLVFSKIHISKFNEDWIIGVDKKPFSQEFVTSEEARTVKRVYYIQFLGSGLVTQVVVKEYRLQSKKWNGNNSYQDDAARLP
jgi:hypothetical protein